MWRAVWSMERHKAGLWYLGSLFVLMGYVLLYPTPLGAGDALPVLLGAVHGWAIAFGLFRDAPGTAPFVFSRPFSRARLFWYRWALGLSLQGATALVLLAFLGSGLRQVVQGGAFDSLWYPMVGWFELSVVRTVALWSFLAYQVTCFVVSRNALLRGDRAPARRWCRGVAVAAVAAIIVLGVLFMGLAAVDSSARPADLLAGGPGLAYVASLAVLTTLSALYAYRHLEVEA